MMVSLKNLHEKSLQEIFDYVVEKLAEQGEPSFDNRQKSCMYRMKKDGKILNCAAGFLMPQETEEEMELIEIVEGKNFDAAIEVFKTKGYRNLARPSVDSKLVLIIRLQRAHDGPQRDSTKKWCAEVKEKLLEVANSFDLDETSVNKYWKEEKN